MSAPVIGPLICSSGFFVSLRPATTNPQLATGPQKCVVLGPVGELIHVLSAPDILVAITRCGRATVSATVMAGSVQGDFSSSLPQTFSAHFKSDQTAAALGVRVRVHHALGARAARNPVAVPRRGRVVAR